MNDIVLMPTSPQALMSRLETLDIPFTLFEHEAVFTVSESKKLEADIPALHIRNMFLRTKKKQNFLVTLSDNTPVDLKKLADLLDVKNFSFGSLDRLMETLGVYPGSVTPLSAINAAPTDITIILEKKMMDADIIAMHPLINTMTVTLKPSDLLLFLDNCGHAPKIIDLSDAAPD